MEEILQGFLTFSRPLVPLSQEEVDLQELCRSALTLHEGIAHARNVLLKMRAERSVSVSCDPRKVQQILINLLQNAIQASPPGASVDLSLHSVAGAARVEIRDHGPGVLPALVGHLFEPGLTSKPTGSGLGLTVANVPRPACL